MLKFDGIIPQAEGIVEEKFSESVKKLDILDFAIKTLQYIKPEDFKELNYDNTKTLFGTPIEPPGKSFKIEKTIAEYTAVASDGSEVPINEDFVFPYYIINIGFVALKYGKEHFFSANSQAKIYYEENELYEKFDGKNYIVRGELLSSKMLMEESKKLNKLLKNFHTIGMPIISLFDGTLIQWEIGETNSEYKKNFLENFQLIFQTAEQLKSPIAGYISGTHSKDTIETIKLFLGMRNLDFDEYAFSLIKDADLFDRILKKGYRSALFRSNAPILNFYRSPIYYFFLNVGSETVRVEIPEFIATNKTLLEMTCSLILSQTDKGKGYPVILKEAHEQAVIKNSEKNFIEGLFIELMRKKELKVNYNYKFLSKKMRGI